MSELDFSRDNNRMGNNFITYVLARKGTDEGCNYSCKWLRSWNQKNKEYPLPLPVLGPLFCDIASV